MNQFTLENILTENVALRSEVKIDSECHYENRPIQIYRKFYLEELKIFR